MNQEESLEIKKKQKFSLWAWFKNNPFYLTVIFFILLFFLLSWLWQDKRKFFRLVKKEDKILITGLEKKDYENLDLDQPIIYTHKNLGGYEYSLKAKNTNLWDKIRGTSYYALSEIKPEEIDQAWEADPKKIAIDWEGKVLSTRLVIPENNNWLHPDKKFLPDLLGKVAMTLLVILIVDFILGGQLISKFASFSGSRRRRTDVTDDSGVRFKDIGGLDEAKEELQEIITYFRNPQVFWKRGAQVPKGVLLVGPPGNGKTLLAKALAGECKLPFIYRSAPEFEKGIIGWGAADVRNTFALARKYAQERGGCFIFVDEIDAIAGKRHQSVHSHHETLNQLLNELDGFSPRENVIFLAATNSLNVLDPALLRPGRLDRHIYIPFPNFKARQEIISLYARKKQFTADVDWKEITSMTKGMSSAQIMNMFNEATILTVRYHQKAISQVILLEAFDRVLMGPALKSQVLTPETKKLVAYHEAGHAVVGLTLPELVVRKITIIPRWTAGGYTWIDLRNKEDDTLVNKQEILAQIMSLLGGRISEELVFGTSYVTTGNYSDYKRVSELTRDLILRYSMSDLGIIATQDSPLFGEESLNELSEAARQKFENERWKILSECQQKVRQILQEKRKSLDLLAQALITKNTLHREEIYYIFINERLPEQVLLE
ncbi:AAA family ATPase [endosymbiont GvMRE of Glomus versiforme]|uniref:AAA family ATPase n=1 Tax=endosymbiont GvMRE of Glomus versiforme TaxID=2039283 RepID=UPI000EC85195|nr:AAA family ATPase [endosymbiont GvMRE of Glomus versiforme]RHZ36511.1 ATP-dependent zinc metalloprotease FtsH [endosymbiont GvMRE of Glomus versiforme]